MGRALLSLAAAVAFVGTLMWGGVLAPTVNSGVRPQASVDILDLHAKTNMDRLPVQAAPNLI